MELSTLVRTEAKLEAVAVAEKEQALRLVGCWASSMGPKALLKSGQAVCPCSSGAGHYGGVVGCNTGSWAPFFLDAS